MELKAHTNPREKFQCGSKSCTSASGQPAEKYAWVRCTRQVLFLSAKYPLQTQENQPEPEQQTQCQLFEGVFYQHRKHHLPAPGDLREGLICIVPPRGMVELSVSASALPDNASRGHLAHWKAFWFSSHLYQLQ